MRHSEASRRAVLNGLSKRVMTMTVLSITTLAVGTQPLQAQRIGSRFSHDATNKDGTTAIRLMAECYYDRSPKSVTAWMNMLPGQAAENQLVARDAIKLAPCLDDSNVVFDNKQVSFQPGVLRPAVGAAMARRMLARMPNQPAPLPDAKPWFVPLLKNLAADAPRDLNALVIQDFGHCVAVTRWNASIALIKSADNSPEEKAAVQALVPALGSCLESGSKIKITKRTIREMIGEPIYHLLLATPPSEKR